jgi:molybdopterin synthase catalytic subunit
MVVKLRLFAMLRERAGTAELELELPDGACVGDALAQEQVARLADGLPLVMAVNREYADAAEPLHAGDELALIPPVSGGAATGSGVAYAVITERPLAPDELVERVRDPRAGAVVTFQGVTREVGELHYEAYADMARERIEAIVLAATERHGLCAAAAAHRVGAVPLSEPSVAIAASAPHRAAAFAGAREIIDAIKAQAPIWKKEVERDRSQWVSGRQPTS